MMCCYLFLMFVLHSITVSRVVQQILFFIFVEQPILEESFLSIVQLVARTMLKQENKTILKLDIRDRKVAQYGSVRTHCCPPLVV